MEGRQRKRKIKRKIKRKKGGRNHFGWLAKISGRHDAAVVMNPELMSKIVFQTK
jgi:hypothetical protein